MNTVATSFQAITFFADGKHINTIEVCDTAKEAIIRAEQWAQVGHISKAVLVVANLITHSVETYELS